MLLEVVLQTDQFNVLAVGHAVKTRPPALPHPLTALGLVAKAVSKAEVVASPVIVAVAGVEHVLAVRADVGRVTVIFAMPAEPAPTVDHADPLHILNAGVVTL
jgi:hypothetical protein